MKTSLTVRIDESLKDEIDRLADDHKSNRTKVTENLLQRGLASLNNYPLPSENWATKQELSELKDLLMTILEKVAPK